MYIPVTGVRERGQGLVNSLKFVLQALVRMSWTYLLIFINSWSVCSKAVGE